MASLLLNLAHTVVTLKVNPEKGKASENQYFLLDTPGCV